MKRLFYILASSLVLFSCAKQDGLVVPTEFGVKTSAYTLPCTEGSFNLDILADGDFTITLDDAPWLSLGGGARTGSGNGDSSLEVFYQMNRSIARSAVIPPKAVP